MTKLTLHPDFARVLEPAYGPCPAFGGTCSTMPPWDPQRGHVPRGFAGAAGTLDEIELVLVFAEPGKPHEGERHEAPFLESAYDYTTSAFKHGMDQYHRNVRGILDRCWPGHSFNDQMKKVWMVDSVLCSVPGDLELGSVPSSVARTCGESYLLKQLKLVPDALVVAMGGKAQARLRALDVEFLPAIAAAPPGCNSRKAKPSWDRIQEAICRRRQCRSD